MGFIVNIKQQQHRNSHCNECSYVAIYSHQVSNTKESQSLTHCVK